MSNSEEIKIVAELCVAESIKHKVIYINKKYIYSIEDCHEGILLSSI